MNAKQSWFADLTLLLVAFVWGATFVVVQNAVQLLPPNTFNGVRFAVASLFLFAVLAFRGLRGQSAFSPGLLGAGVFIGIWLFAGYAFQTVGLLYTSPSKAGFITGLSVVLVPLFAFLLLKEKTSPSAVAGVLLAVVGLYLLTLGESLAVNWGDVLVLCCAVSFALQIVFTGRYAPLYPALPLAIVQLVTVSVLSFLYALFFEDWSRVLDPGVILADDVVWGLIITAIPATALAFLAQTAFQKQTSPTRVALIFALEPVFAALTAYLWVDEVLTVRKYIGCALIFAGMLLAELPVAAWWKAWRHPSAAAAPASDDGPKAAG